MRYICQICGYIYDDAKEKIPFEELPEDWKCPLCGAAKSDFKKEEPVEEKPTAKKQTEQKPVIKQETEAAEDLQKLSIGQMAAVLSNLARGCEKQYKPEEAKLFSELADYFTKIMPQENDATAQSIANALKTDTENYPELRKTADQNGDRGAARVCVWGEKVTRMLYSLVSRYLKEGENLLAGTNIWVCTVCGFVYIGDKAPELCPVCKVPAWKFEKIEGRADK